MPNPLNDRKPVEILENWNDMLIFRSLCEGMSMRISNMLEFCLLMPKYNELQ